MMLMCPCPICEKNSVNYPYHVCSSCERAIEEDPAYRKCQEQHWQDCMSCTNLVCCDNMRPEARGVRERSAAQKFTSPPATRLVEAPKMMKVYKIRNRDTGLFSTGGCEPKWTKNGKAWSSEGSLKSHLTMWMTAYGYHQKDGRRVPNTWEVLVYTFTNTSTSSSSARELAERPAKK